MVEQIEKPIRSKTPLHRRKVNPRFRSLKGIKNKLTNKLPTPNKNEISPNHGKPSIISGTPITARAIALNLIIDLSSILKILFKLQFPKPSFVFIPVKEIHCFKRNNSAILIYYMHTAFFDSSHIKIIGINKPHDYYAKQVVVS